MKVSRRAFLQAGASAALAAPTILTSFPARAAVEADAGEILIVGFLGTDVSSPSAQALAGHLAAGRAGGVMVLGTNVSTRDEVVGLTGIFTSSAPGALIAIDHEGGRVQRLSTEHGFTRLVRAEHIPLEYSVEDATALYTIAGEELRAAGFNLNLAPVVDLHDPENPVIGGNGRSFAADPLVVADYAAACVDGFGAAGVVTALKHFPGHGHSRGDSHDGPVDITDTWRPEELIPFRRLINRDRAEIVMAGHLINRNLAADGLPATLSRQMISGVLKADLGHRGVTITDDLDMEAIRSIVSLEEAVIGAIAAGNDLLILSNTLEPNDALAADAVGWITQAVADRRLPESRLASAARRVRALKRGLG